MPLKKSSPSVSSGWQPALFTWYDPALGGTNSASGLADPHSPTASGEPYDANALTCAAPPAFAFGTMLDFSYGGKTITCKVNDRGGAITGSHFDLSRRAASDLGMIAAGSVQGQYRVSSGASTPGGATPISTSPGSAITAAAGAATGLISGTLSDVGAKLALIGVNIIKDIVLAGADYIIIPAWHWNQRAVMYYQKQILFNKDRPDAIAWTAAFWGLSYWLLWTDPNAKGMMPAPVRNARIARRVRGLQALPARQSLVKPKDVKGKTPKKPKPVVSRAIVTQTGTLRATRNQPVRISGENDTGRSTARPSRSEARIRRTGTLPSETEVRRNATQGEPHTKHRTGDSSLPNSTRNSHGGSGEGRRTRS